MQALTETGETVELTDAFSLGDATFIREVGTNVGFVWLPDGWTLDAPDNELTAAAIIAWFINVDGRCFSGDDAFNLFVEELARGESPAAARSWADDPRNWGGPTVE